MKTSVIIPVREVTRELQEAIPYLLDLAPPADEIIVVTDQGPKESMPARIKVLVKKGGPAAKRDWAARHAQGELLAFLDDDAYPRRDWLAQAWRHLTDPTVAAVGGPAITPPSDGWQAQVSGAVLTSWLGSGPARRRYWPTGQVRDIDDWPSVNLLVRKAVFVQVGGFDTNYWPGEDTKLCLDIVNQGWRIVYDPKVLVFHHRATTLIKHLKQIGRYGLHRGYYAKIFPQTSWRLSYFLPTVFLWSMAVAAGLSLFSPATRTWLTGGVVVALAAAGLAGVVEAVRSRRYWLVLIAPWLLLATHLVYGAAFIIGLTSPKLGSYQRRQR